MCDKLWYRTPASSWMEGLPIGNGRLAAMVWGTKEMDRLSLNHEWLWRGVHRHRDNPPCVGHLEEVRRFLREGDFFRATTLANVYYGGLGGVARSGLRVDPYQPAGDLCFELDGVTRFAARALDIASAVARAERETSAATVRSAFIAHPVHHQIIARWAADAGVFSGTLLFTRAEDPQAEYSYTIGAHEIRFQCGFTGGIRYTVRIQIRTDGAVSGEETGLRIQNASHLEAFVNIATSESGMEEELARYPVPQLPWDALLASHQAAFSSLLGRLRVHVDVPGNDLPTDARVAALKAGAQDPALLLLYFQYGRYLLASSSIRGQLPANLQGKWNDSVEPPWECDYHFDINIQMNYWMAEAANMHECAEALLQYVERLVPHGRKAAMDLYGCRGIYLPITNDAWGRATPEACGYAAWIGVAPWMAQHFWWHYLYSGDLDFLRDRAYPFFAGVAEFFQDYLVEDEAGVLQIMPSQSPENRFVGTGFWPVSLGISSAVDVQLVHDALGYAVQAGRILNVDAARVEQWAEMQRRLPPFGIGRDGRLLEWDREREEAEPGHRHLSHLYGLYPSNLFNPKDRPLQYEAAIRSLKTRLALGGGHTGWSRAWVACLFARIGDADGLWEHMQALVKDFATASLLDLHPPYIFQIDGNLGAVAAVLDGLVQCWGGRLHLLRALPAAWGTGSVSGIRAPGGHELSMAWQAGELIRADVRLGYAGEAILAGLAGRMAGEGDGRVQADGGDLVLKGREGDLVRLRPMEATAN